MGGWGEVQKKKLEKNTSSRKTSQKKCGPENRYKNKTGDQKRARRSVGQKNRYGKTK